jgi:hypothetical protein
MDYRNLEKLYPVKIPVYDHAEYYLETLSRSDEYEQLPDWIQLCQDLETIPNYEKEKYRKMDDAIVYFKEIGAFNKLNEMEMPNFSSSSKELEAKEGKVYLSLDVRQANWSVIKHFLELDLPEWETFAIATLNMHPALVYSKTVRQLIFGNWNPKRIQNLQKSITAHHLGFVNKDKVVGLNAEEIIMEVETPDDVKQLMDLPWVLPVKGKLFRSEFVKNFGETVRIDTMLNDDFSDKYRKLTKVNGNRFFMHFKTLILQDEIDERDLLFINDRNLAQWKI